MRSWPDARERGFRLACDGGWSVTVRREGREHLLEPVRWTARDPVAYDFAALQPRIEAPDGIRIGLHPPQVEPPLDALLPPGLRDRALRGLEAGRILHVDWRGEEGGGVAALASHRIVAGVGMRAHPLGRARVFRGTGR